MQIWNWFDPPKVRERRRPFEHFTRVLLVFAVLCLFLVWATRPWIRLWTCMHTINDPQAPTMAAVFLFSALGFGTGFFRIRKHPSLSLLAMTGRLMLWATLFGGVLTGFFRFLFTPEASVLIMLETILLSSGFSVYPALIVSILFTLGQKITGNLHK